MRNFVHIPEHVQVKIREEDLNHFTALLDIMGFSFTPIQIFRPGALYSKIKTERFQGKDVELHVRVYQNGVITSEFEPKRLKHPLDHIFSRSYSAHEWVISKLEKFGIPYEVDEGIRFTYNLHAPTTFPKHPSELFKWLWGCIYYVPLAMIWHGWRYLKMVAAATYRSSLMKLMSLLR
ncbi:MAG: hypothetical protein D6732_27230 [Methanobacteriota archaeon]|nr:MAG: hypothetical protein D6732_27230 [Euryarchaeota archaeon]